MNLTAAKRMIRNTKRIQVLHLKDNRTMNDVTINENDIVRKFEEQKGLCHWSNIPMDISFNSIPNHPLAISIDRIDPTIGYTYDNIRLVLRIFNLGRNRYDSDGFTSVVSYLAKEMNARLV